MKKLLLAAVMLASGASAFAQAPDISGLKKGDEITDKVSWQNLSFEDGGNGWNITTTSGDGGRFGGAVEFYNGSGIDLYQIVPLKAGLYRMECQGYYRCGGEGEEWQLMSNGGYVDNGIIYVQNGTYDESSNTFTASRTFKSPVMPRLFEKWPEAIYMDGEDEGWGIMDDHQYEDSYWGPISFPGSVRWFQAGRYNPVEGEKYNTVTFFLMEDGYVKVGASKLEAKGNDSFFLTNFKMFYEGEAGEAVEIIAMQDEIAEYYHKLEEMEAKYDGLMYTLISDARMEFDAEFSNIESLTKAECELAIPLIKGIYENATAAEEYYKELESIMPTMNILFDKTNYAGKPEFAETIKAANNCIVKDYESAEEDSFDTFKKAYENVVAARITYLMTQEQINGAYDFSSAINNPFMCNNEYTPTWDAEANAYKFVDEIEDTYSNIQEQSYSEIRNEHSDWIDYASEFVLSEKECEGRWIIKSTTWHGGGAIGVTQQHGYPAIGGWTAEPTGNAEILYQNISGLPNGYYAMSGLMCNAGAEISPLQYVFIEAGESKEIANLTQQGNPWWGGNRDQWRQTVWEKLTTSMVYVSDGTVKIGASSDAFYATTGFQLYYYGETPDFSTLLAPAIAAAKEKIETLAWEGDKAAANEILSSVPSTITSQDEYQLALDCINDVYDYVAKANNAVNNFASNILPGFEALADKYAASNPEAEIALAAQLGALEVGENPTDTYEKAADAAKDLTAYQNYLSFYQDAKKYENNAELAALLKTQGADLSANYANADKLAEYMAALATPYNKALLAALGADKASATNPVDVTALIVNPNYDEDQKGWSGDNLTFNFDPSSVEKPHTAEKWNTNFDTYQTIYSLPAGTYRIQVQSIYRDGGAAQDAWNNWQGAAEAMDLWDNQNAKLYANDNETSIVSLASYKSTTRSMDSFRDKMVEAPEADAQGNIVWLEHWNYQFKNEVTDPETGEVTLEDLDEDNGKTDWWWDNKIYSDLDEEYYFYPASLWGISQRFAKSPEAYINTVEVTIPEGGSIKFGIRKETLINADWVVMDNWKLFYLGADPTAIENVANTAAASEIYNVAGVRQNSLNKGINVVKMTNGTVRKVFVK